MASPKINVGSSSPFSEDLGKAGQEFAQQGVTHVVNQGEGAEKIAGAIAEQGKAKDDLLQAQASQQSSEMMSKGIVDATNIFAKGVDAYQKGEVTSSLSDQLNALQKGVQLEGVKDAFTASALADPSVRGAYNELQSIKALRDQGYSNESSIKMRAEAIIKKYINQSPQYSAEIRRIAQETIGFDPTGTQLQVQGGFGAQPAPKTPEQKAADAYQQQIYTYALTNGVTPEEAADAIQTQSKVKQDTAALQARIAAGKVNDLDVKNKTNEIASQVDTEISMSLVDPTAVNAQDAPMTANHPGGLFGALVTTVQTKDGLNTEDTLHFKTEIAVLMQSQLNKALALMGPGATLQQRTQMTNNVRARFEVINKLVESGDFTKIYKDKLSSMTDSAKIKLFNDPKSGQYLLTVYSLAGSGGMVQAINDMQKWADAGADTTRKLSPGTAFLADVVGNQKIMMDTSIQMSSGTIPKGKTGQEKTVMAETGMSAFYNSNLPTTARMIGLKTAITNAGPAKALQFFNSTKGQAAVFNDPLVKQQFQNLFGNELEGTMRKSKEAIATLKARGFTVNITPDGNVTFKNPEGKVDITALASSGGISGDTIQQGQTALKDLPMLFGLIKQYGSSLGTTQGLIDELNSAELPKEGVGTPTNPKDVSSTAPRNLRNNNPGNLRPGENKFDGQTGADSGGHAIFDTPEAGLRAMSIVLDKYEGRGQDSVSAIITGGDTKFAYAEGNRKEYIAFVSEQLGVRPNEKIDLKDPETKAALMDAMIKFEGDRTNPNTKEQMLEAAKQSSTKVTYTVDKFSDETDQEAVARQQEFQTKLWVAEDTENNLHPGKGLEGTEDLSKATEDINIIPNDDVKPTHRTIDPNNITPEDEEIIKALPTQSRANIQGLVPEMKAILPNIIADLKALGFDPVIDGGHRTIAEQQKKKDSGASKTMKSNHLHGGAVDIVDRKIQWSGSKKEIARFAAAMQAVAAKYGLESGVPWKSYGASGDFAHLQLPKKMLAGGKK